MTHEEHIAENDRQIAELHRIVKAGPKGSAKVRRAWQMIGEFEADTAWRLQELEREGERHDD